MAVEIARSCIIKNEFRLRRPPPLVLMRTIYIYIYKFCNLRPHVETDDGKGYMIHVTYNHSRVSSVGVKQQNLLAWRVVQPTAAQSNNRIDC